MPLSHSLAPFAKSALVALAATLLIGRSPDLEATGDKDAAVAAAQAQAQASQAPKNAELLPGEARVDDLELSTELAPSLVHPKRLAIHLSVKNPTEHEIKTRCLLALERYTGSPMSRVSPPPTIAWKHSEELELGANATVTREIELPPAVGAAVMKAEKTARAAEAKGVIPTRYESYGVSAIPRLARNPPRPLVAGRA